MASGNAVAQNPFAGAWNCQMTFTQYSRPNVRHSGWGQQFLISLQPNGTFQAQGTMQSIAGRENYRAQGRWQFGRANGRLSFTAQGARTDRMVGQSPFIVNGFLGPQGRSIMQRIVTPWSNGQGIQQLTLMQCGRTR